MATKKQPRRIIRITFEWEVEGKSKFRIVRRINVESLLKRSSPAGYVKKVREVTEKYAEEFWIDCVQLGAIDDDN